jgi:hypothetical protein
MSALPEASAISNAAADMTASTVNKIAGRPINNKKLL